VSSCKGSEDFELFVEEVIAMSPISHTIVNYQLLEDLNCSVAVERQIFTVAIDDLALLL
jgi:hypothetical protein